MKKLLLLFFTFCLLSCGNSTPSDSDVKEAGRAVILNNLKDPTTAKFHHNELIKDNGDSTFVYHETINATNGFGGSIKQDATVTIKWTGGNPSELQSWSIIDVQFY